MGNHTTQQDTPRFSGLAGRGAFTALAALALVGGGAGVAFADEAPADAGHDATQSAQQHDSKASGDHKSSDDKSSDQKGSDQKGSDQKGSDQGGSGLPSLPSLSSLPGADSLASLPGLSDAQAAAPAAADQASAPAAADQAASPAAAGQAAGSSAPIVSSILGG